MKIDKIIPNNKANIVILNNGKETCLLIGITFSRDINMLKTGTKTVLNYEDLTMAIYSM
jgi:hypothetical protein